MELDLSRVLGQARAQNYLGKAFAAGRIAHAYVFTGADGVGKSALAQAFGQALLCDDAAKRPCGGCVPCKQSAEMAHPGQHLLFPHLKTAKQEELDSVRKAFTESPYAARRQWPGSMLSIDAIRGLRRALSLKSYQGGARVVLILDAHAMTLEAANGLLKMLEEPPEKTYFFLLSSAPDRLLATIRSRCQPVRLANLGLTDLESGLARFSEVSKERGSVCARLAGGSLRRALELTEAETPVLQADAIELLRAAFKPAGKGAVFVRELTSRHDKWQLREVLLHLLAWIRDGYLLAASGDESCVSNLDQLDVLKKFVAGFPGFAYPAAMQEVETSIEMIDRYVQPALVLLVLVRKLARLGATATRKAA